MKLYVLRHGTAEEAAASLNDFDRALTAKGRKRTREVARVLQQRGEIPHLILSSPLVRALQTAEIAASVLDPPEPVGVRQEIAPGGDLIGLVRELASAGKKPAMVVGHEPGMSMLVEQLLGVGVWGRPVLKSMVVAMRVDERGRGKLRFVLDPKNLQVEPFE
jgi:phosphohistidine phosphatase